MAYDVREVGNAVLEAAATGGFALSNMSLNKIVYFVHGWFLAQYGEPLVDSPFEAWQYGPVHPQIYRQFKAYRDQPIQSRLSRIDLATGAQTPFPVNLPAREAELIERITLFYGRYTAAKLVEISHQPGAPWDQVWSSAEGEPCPGMQIPDAVTESYYRGRLNKLS